MRASDVRVEPGGLRGGIGTVVHVDGGGRVRSGRALQAPLCGNPLEDAFFSGDAEYGPMTADIRVVVLADAGSVPLDDATCIPPVW